MIIVNGMEYKTLAQNLYADGKKVLAAYCNGNLVYPEREDAMFLKVIGNINTMISHDHNGENHTVVAGGGAKQYTYHGGDDYRAKGCFSLGNYSAPQSQHTFPSSAKRIASKGFTPCFLAVLI